MFVVIIMNFGKGRQLCSLHRLFLSREFLSKAVEWEYLKQWEVKIFQIINYKSMVI